MDQPISIREVRAAVQAIDDALNRFSIVEMDTWDDILPNLIAAHDLCGGTVRIRLQQAFEATYVDVATVRSAIDRLAQHLGAEPSAEPHPARPAQLEFTFD